ncbi:MAG: hypothetical protein E3J56_12685 [Candidatus Aminicenantes bacterium]|nr:MAG: hypothetical protein E3J56_12685 [Candidatus Aminicenantes bacterium]
MTPETYIEFKQKLIEKGYASEIDWVEDLKLCDNPGTFEIEAVWVICNSGIQNQVAEKIFLRILKAIDEKRPIIEAFKNKQKVQAMEFIIQNRCSLFEKFIKAEDKIQFLESLPFIGKITKYHLARNLGLDVCKPDRHLVRIASQYKITPVELCRRLSDKTGDKIGTVDIVLWRAANLGMI